MPYHFATNNDYDVDVFSDRIDIYCGLSAEVKLRQRFSFLSKVNYVDRENARVFVLHHIGGSELIHYKVFHINVDLLLQYEILNMLKIGLGPSMIRNIDAYEHEGTNRDIYSFRYGNLIDNNYIFGLSVALDYRYRRLGFRVLYNNAFGPDTDPVLDTQFKNRVEAGVYYRIISH